MDSTDSDISRFSKIQKECDYSLITKGKQWRSFQQAYRKMQRNQPPL